MLARLDAAAARQWCDAAASALQSHRDEIDALNVFPIPDGDTGSNLASTLQSAADAVATRFAAAPVPAAIGGDASPASPQETAGDVLQTMARGAVLGARGNSGVIMSQVLRGLARAFRSAADVDAPVLAAGLRSACDAAYASVSDPVEGTILSVIKAAAEAAESRLADPDGLAGMVRAVSGAAHQALALTPKQLPVLADAGVVDAGGFGLVVLLDALTTVLTGDPPVLPVSPSDAPGGPSGSRPAGHPGPRFGDATDAEFAYEVQFLLDAEPSAIEPLKRMLSLLGDSIAVGQAEGDLYSVHVHVNDVGAALEAGVRAGRPHGIRVTRFADRIASHAHGHGDGDGDARASRTGSAVVAVAPGLGLADLFRSEGVAVVDGGPTRNPSTLEVLDRIRESGASRIVLLPNASAVTGVAEMAAAQARLEGLTVAVVPTKSPVQGLAAIAIHDDTRRFDDDVIAMAETAAATRFAEVTIAVRDSITYAGRCAAGDVLGLIDGEVVQIGSSVPGVAIDVVERLIGVGAELVTILAGSDDGAAEAAAELEQHLKSRHPLVEVNRFHGGQPDFPLLIGVE